jgi:indolepyruvate ferredoxin oxidoreductase
MVTSTDVRFPDAGGIVAAINRLTRKDENVFVDALGAAETLFGDHMAANMMMLGAAYQAGALPVSAASIERAVALNGVAVEINTQAFRAGRLAIVDPDWLVSIRPRRAGAVEIASALDEEARALVAPVGASGELRRLLEIRVPELIAYQDARYARAYVDFVGRVAATEATRVPGRTRLAEAVARYLFKLMAYKDEYEVARLHLKTDVAATFADQYPGGARIAYQLLPPVLRAFGLQRKLGLGRWMETVFGALVRMRGLRGTALDPFGRAAVRRVERALPAEYRALIDKALVDLSPETYERAVKLANAPDLIRGYEEVKLRGVERFREEVRTLGY